LVWWRACQSPNSGSVGLSSDTERNRVRVEVVTITRTRSPMDRSRGRERRVAVSSTRKLCSTPRRVSITPFREMMRWRRRRRAAVAVVALGSLSKKGWFVALPLGVAVVVADLVEGFLLRVDAARIRIGVGPQFPAHRNPIVVSSLSGCVIVTFDEIVGALRGRDMEDSLPEGVVKGQERRRRVEGGFDECGVVADRVKSLFEVGEERRGSEAGAARDVSKEGVRGRAEGGEGGGGGGQNEQRVEVGEVGDEERARVSI